MTEADLTPEDWRAILLAIVKQTAKEYLLKGFWIGMLVGWCAGGLTMVVLQ